MRRVRRIIIHCSASPNGRADTIRDVDRWHKERGFLRSLAFRSKYRPELTSCGYHACIHTDGTVALGRHTDEVGAHAAGYNHDSIGVCLIGTDEFSPEQIEALELYLQSVLAMYPNATVMGHKDLPGVKKSCPGFNVAKWMEGRAWKEPSSAT